MKLKDTRYGEYELLLDDVTQGDVEKFFKALRTEFDADLSGVEYLGNSVRVANRIGWIEPKIDVDKAKPKLVRVIAEQINEVLSEALSVDPS